MKHFKHPLVVIALLFGTLSFGGAIKTWVAGEPLTAAQLNAAFQHIHSLMVGGHGPRLVNADVSGTANIATSKLQRGSLIPVAAAKVYDTGAKDTPCNSDPCGFSGFGVEEVEWSFTGGYVVTFTSNVSADAVVHVTASKGATLIAECHPNINFTAPQDFVGVYCKTTDGTSDDDADLVFSITVLEP